MIEEQEVGGRPAAEPWSVAELDALVTEIGGHVVPLDDVRSCLAQVEVLESLKAAAAAAQIRITQAYALREAARIEALQQTAGPAGRRRPTPAGPVVGAQLGLARRESPARGRFLTQAAAAQVNDLPHTLAALSRGEINEERALLVVRETEDLSPDARRVLDAELAPGAGGLGTAALRLAVQRLALRLDEQAASRRMRLARARRHVSGSLLSDGTGWITAVVRSEHYAAILATLRKAAASARSAGDPRTADQVRADALVERLTGIDAQAPRSLDLHLVLGMTSLVGESDEPGWVPGAGYLPASVCRDLLAAAAESDLLSVRRLFTLPDDGQLVAMEQKSRLFSGLLARMVRLRDGGTCRTPWCDAPIRHVDHVVPDHEGGATSFENAQGLCEACNQVKEAPGWVSWVGWQGGGPDIGTITSIGRTCWSKPPPLAC